jgi:hypothetical protein
VRALPVLTLVAVAAVAICVGGCGSAKAKPKSASAWLSQHGLLEFESTFPPALQNDIGDAAPIAIADADCTRTSKSGVYLCTLHTESMQPIAYFVTVKGKSARQEQDRTAEALPREDQQRLQNLTRPMGRVIAYANL